MVEEGKVVDVHGSVVLRDCRRGAKLAEVAITDGTGRAADLPATLIGEIALDGWCDEILRLKCQDGVVAIPVESLRRGTRITASPDFTPGMPSCGAIFLQGFMRHGCTSFTWSGRSRGRPGSPEWCLDVRAGEIEFGASACQPSIGWTTTASRFVTRKDREQLDLGRLPIDYAPPIVVARLELPPDAVIPIGRMRVRIEWEKCNGYSGTLLDELIPAPVSLVLRLHAHIDPDGDGDVEVWWGALHGRLEGCSLAAAPETIRMEWNIWVDTYVSAPDPELLLATRFECRSASGIVTPDDRPGRCAFSGLSPGKYTIIAHRPQGGPWTYNFEIPNDLPSDRFLIPRLEPFADLHLERK